MKLPRFNSQAISPEEYAAQWGGDPVYMKEPNLPGDGYLFYNFSVEQDDPEFLRKFIPAVERTILLVQQNPDDFAEYDVANLRVFLDYIKGLLSKIGVS